MFADAENIVAMPKRVRAAVSNGTRLLEGVDGRSSAARRFRDLVADLTREHAGDRELSTAERSIIRQAATILLRIEQMQAEIVKGQAVDSDTLIRLSSEARRLLGALASRRGALQRGDDEDELDRYLASKAQEAAGT